jgi:hypothetical protein
VDNRIRRITVRDRMLTPAQAEVWINVEPEQRTPATELRGRLMGPRCLYSSTIEVAYPLRPLPPDQQQPQAGAFTQRIVIPEPSFWEPQCPFLYQGPIELWQDGQRCEQVMVSHGLRFFQRSEGELRVNGRPLTLRARRIGACSDEEAALWRQAGYNLLIAPVAANSLVVWEQADRFGFLVLGQLGEDADEKRLVEMLEAHASCLGWLNAECREVSVEEAVRVFLSAEPRP